MDSHQNPHRLKARVAIPWTITRIVLTVIFSVVIVVALVFPAAAQAYAQASIPALGDGAVSNIPIPEDEPIAPSDSLDIRSLPLLDERSATLWEDPSNADTVGRTVFADQWDALMEAANSPISSLDIMPFTTVDNSTLDHVREIVAQRLDELGSEGEQKALNLMSLLENYGDIRASGDERNGDLLIIAAALAYELPEHYNSCDTWLNAMHFFEMFVRDNDDDVREHFDKAVAGLVRHNREFLIGRLTAERLRREFGIFDPNAASALKVYGRDLLSGVPSHTEIPISLVRAALKEPLEECVRAIRSMIDRTPPDVRRAIETKGIYLTGGVANLRGLSTYLEGSIGLPVTTVADPELCVVKGLQKIILTKGYYKKLTYSMLDENYRWLR